MIEVQNLSKDFITSKKYPGFRGTVKSLFTRETITKHAVSDMSFHVKKGEILGYIGSNGAGKSTTIKMLTGILVPTSGQCLVNGIEPHKHRTQNAKNIGVVFGQRTQLWWDLPLTETFTVLKEIYQIPTRDYQERMSFINEVLGLDEFQHQTVRTLSLGQRMRSDLGAALLHNPKVLFLDEPTIGLDVHVKDKIRKAIKEMKDQFSTTIVLTTHDLTDIEELCDHLILIDESHKIYDGTLAGLKKEFGSDTILELDLNLSDLFTDHDLVILRKDHPSISFQFQEGTLQCTFNKDKNNVSKLVSQIMNQYNVRDIRITESDLTSIVKKIYQNDNKGGISI